MSLNLYDSLTNQMHICHNNLENIFHVAAKLLGEDLYVNFSIYLRLKDWATWENLHIHIIKNKL